MSSKPTLALALAVAAVTWAGSAAPAAAQAPGEARDVPPAETTAEPAPATPSEAPAADAPGAPVGVTPAPTKAAPAGGVWDEGFDDLDHVVTLELLNRRADDVQRKISALQDRVNLLRETVIVGAIEPTRVVILHVNEMEKAFALEQVAYTLDGQVLLTKADKDGSLDGQRYFEVLNGALPAGEHQVEVTMVFKGRAGVFDYFEGYRFKVESKWTLKVAEGRVTQLDVVAYQKPDITLPPQERLAIRYDVEVRSDEAGTVVPPASDE